MIIRSQDKKSITTDLNLEILKPYNIKSGSWDIISNTSGTIAKYSTEEKAIKVLDMIEKEYGRHYYGEGGPLTTMNHYVEPFAFIPPKVFQMPQDSEV